uniref:hairy-related 9 isoform X2 n=1 Tax=Pristiophorus japonicus TaxID=55135 RepID=UPI00398EC5C4
MPADTMEKSSICPTVGSSATSPQTPDKPKSASENRKSSKPIMEKRRRARINESLTQLKTLILDALKKDVSWLQIQPPNHDVFARREADGIGTEMGAGADGCKLFFFFQSSRHSKLEKADILEMTVKHLRNLQRVQMTALTADPTVLGKYRAGFNECMNEVTRFLSTCEGVNADVRSRLLGHLSSCLGHMVAMNYTQSASNPAAGPGGHLAQPLHVQLPATVPVSGGVTNLPCKLSPAEAVSPKVYGGFQLVPAADGHFAFLIPNPSFASSSGQIANIPLYANANLPLTLGSANSKLAASPTQGMTSISFGPNIPGVSQTHSPLGVSTGPDSSESVWRPW